MVLVLTFINNVPSTMAKDFMAFYFILIYLPFAGKEIKDQRDLSQVLNITCKR